MSVGMTGEQNKWWESIANSVRWVAFLPGGLLGGMLAAFSVSVIFGGYFG